MARLRYGTWMRSLVLGLLVLLAGCGSAEPSAPSSALTVSPTNAPSSLAHINDVPTETMPPVVTPEPAPEPQSAPPSEHFVAPKLPSGSIQGRKIALDPGHNGGNSKASGTVNAKIPDGRGGTKACNTTGTSTNSGYPEHAFTWDVAVRTKALLEARGAVVVMTRDSDTGVGPCVNERGQFAEAQDAEILISIHGDGSTDPAHNGFFAIVSEPPLNASQGEPALRLADQMIAALSAHGFSPNSSYRGGLSRRADISGLNWAARPAVLLELGEMRNAGNAAVMESPEGRERYATAIVAGIQAWFGSPVA